MRTPIRGDDTRALRLASGHTLDVSVAPPGAAAQGSDARVAFAAFHGERRAVFLLVEGAAPASAETLFIHLNSALERDRGTPSARLLRAVRHGCSAVEAHALHRFELAGLGLTALLIEGAAAYLAQLPPSQAYVVEPDAVRGVPEAPMTGAGRVASPAGRRWEVELELSRFAIRAGTALVLCTSELGRALSHAHLARAARLPTDEAAASLLSGTSRGVSVALVVTVTGPAGVPPRARLLRPERAARPKRPLVAAPPPAAARAPLKAWGLGSSGTTDGALRLRDFSTVRPRPTRQPPRRGAIAFGVAGVVGTGAAVAGLRQRWLRAGVTVPEAPTAAPSPEPTPVGITLAKIGMAGAPLRSFAAVGGRFFVLDASGSVRAYGAGSPFEPGQEVAGPSRPGLLALIARDADLLALDESRALWMIGPPHRPLRLDGTARWQRPVAFATFGSSLYVLDAGPPAGQIWRHSGAGGEYSGAPQAWLAPDATLRLDNATGFAIDGSIWVARADGTVLKLFGGRLDPVMLRSAGTPVGSAGAVFTHASARSVYVVDTALRRLLRFGKDGELQGEVGGVLSPGDTLVGLWVDEAARRALLLSALRLQQVTLPE